MSRKVLALLGTFFAFSFLFYLGTTREHQEGLKSLLKPLGAPSFKEADEIELSYQGKGFKLKKEGEEWVILSDFKKPARQATVTELLETLADLHGEVRAKGKRYFSRFGVSEREALHLVLKKDGQELAHFLIGKRGPQWESNFLRLKGSQEIYLVPVNLLAKLDIWEEGPEVPQDKAFVDLEVLSLPVKEIKTLSLTGPKGGWTLRREGSKFVFTKDGREKEIAPARAEKFMRKLFPLLAEEVVAPESFKEKGALRLSYELRNGLKGELEISCASKECLVRKKGFVFRVKRENLAPLFKPFEGKD